MAKEVSLVITCTKCGAKIPLTEALLYPFQEQWKRKWEAEELKPQLEAVKGEALDEANKTIEGLKTELARQQKKLSEQSKKEIEEKEDAIKELRGQLQEVQQNLKKAQKYERDLRHERETLQQRLKQIDLEVDRKVDEKVKSKEQDHRLELIEKDKRIAQMQQQIDELQKKSEQISSQIRGDALQYELDRILKSAFPHDSVTVIKRGVKGADIMQEVKEETIGSCGSILLESKNTRKWDDGWIDKLKSDARDKNADIAVLVSVTMPKGIQTFAMKKGVWVTSYSATCCLVDALRFGLVQTTSTRLESENKDQKVEALHSYFTSPSFKQRIEPVIEALKSMYEELNHEKRAMESIWAQREKEIAKAIRGAAGFYGDIRGIIGGTVLPQIESLQLLSGPKG